MMENYIDFKHLLTEEERMVQENIRTFVDQEFLPLVTEHHRAGTFPLQLVPRMAELGVFGASIKEYDLPGLSTIPYGLIMLGIIGLILEMKMPGTTVPGILGAICFVLKPMARSTPNSIERRRKENA